jgi:hypothetical protein
VAIVIHGLTQEKGKKKRSHETDGFLSTFWWHPYCKNARRRNPAMTNQTQTSSYEDLTVRARAEFREMPGMCLTTAQAARLWQLSPARAEELLSELVQSGFLVRREGQRYRLPSSV